MTSRDLYYLPYKYSLHRKSNAQFGDFGNQFHLVHSQNKFQFHSFFES